MSMSLFSLLHAFAGLAILFALQQAKRGRTRKRFCSQKAKEKCKSVIDDCSEWNNFYFSRLFGTRKAMRHFANFLLRHFCALLSIM